MWLCNFNWSVNYFLRLDLKNNIECEIMRNDIYFIVYNYGYMTFYIEKKGDMDNF